MNRVEQKERLGDILLEIKDVKEELKDKIKEVNSAFAKIDDLNDVLYNLGQVDSWDEEQLRVDILNTVFEETLQRVYEQLSDFKSDLDAYMEEISESRKETLEERYYNLEDATDKFEYQSQEYDDIENAIEHIEEAEEMIKEMKK